MSNFTQQIQEAANRLEGIAKYSPLEYNQRLSEKYKAKIYLKREDLQVVRSFKIRGAYNLIAQLNEEDKNKGVVCASAGNHAQGVAYSCHQLGIKGTIFMPIVTPNQKVDKVKNFGGKWVKVKLVGNNFDEAAEAAQSYCKEKKAVFVHPFNDLQTIAGQGTIGYEIYKEIHPDVVMVAIGGGGMISGIGKFLKDKDKAIKIVGVEPKGAASMDLSLKEGKPTTLKSVDTFCDGVAVKTPGDITFKIAQEVVDQMVVVPEGEVATDMIELYQSEGIITEPSGSLPISALSQVANQIEGKTVVCVICGGNNDISRYPEVIERSLIWKGLKHYFVVEFNQKPGQLKKLVNNVLGPNDDIVRFEYIKKTNKEIGAALVGIELSNKEDLTGLIGRFTESGIDFQKIETGDLIYQLLI